MISASRRKLSTCARNAPTPPPLIPPPNNIRSAVNVACSGVIHNSAPPNGSRAISARISAAHVALFPVPARPIKNRTPKSRSNHPLRVYPSTRELTTRAKKSPVGNASQGYSLSPSNGLPPKGGLTFFVGNVTMTNRLPRYNP